MITLHCHRAAFLRHRVARPCRLAVFAHHLAHVHCARRVLPCPFAPPDSLVRTVAAWVPKTQELGHLERCSTCAGPGEHLGATQLFECFT